MRVYCWNGPLRGKVVHVERLPLLVPIYEPISLDWHEDPSACGTVGDYKVGRYDTDWRSGPRHDWGEPVDVFWFDPE